MAVIGAVCRCVYGGFPYVETHGRCRGTLLPLAYYRNPVCNKLIISYIGIVMTPPLRLVDAMCGMPVDRPCRYGAFVPIRNAPSFLPDFRVRPYRTLGSVPTGLSAPFRPGSEYVLRKDELHIPHTYRPKAVFHSPKVVASVKCIS